MPLTTKLISHWALDEASGARVDSVAASANDLTDNNTVTQATGKRGNAAQFTLPNSEYLSRASNSSLQTGDRDFSFVAWAYLDTTATTQHVLAKWFGSTDRGYRLFYSTSVDRFRFGIRDSADGANATINADTLGAPSTATWYMVFCYHDAITDEIGISVNDGTVDTLAHSGGVRLDTAAFIIGARSDPTQYFDGRIDLVNFWKRRLTAADVTKLYAGGVGMTYDEMAFVDTSRAFTLTVGSTSIAPRAGTFGCDSQLGQRGVCEFERVVAQTDSLSAVGEAVTVVHDGLRIFGGSVEEENFWLEAADTSGLIQRVVCVDNNQIADRRRLYRVYGDGTLHAIVTQIVSEALGSEGVTVNSVVLPGPTINGKLPLYITVAEAFDRLAEITGLTWRIDEFKDLRFDEPATLAAPFTVTNASMPVRSLDFRSFRQDYRNDQVVIGGKGATPSRTDSITSASGQLDFALVFPVATVPTITEDASAKTVGIRGLPGDITKDWLWNKGSNIVTRTAAGISASVVVAITYTGLFQIIDRRTNAVEQTARAVVEGGSGKHQALTSDRGVESGSAASVLAEGLLRRYETLPNELTGTTFTAGLCAGQLLTVNLTEPETTRVLANTTYLLGSVSLAELYIAGADARFEYVFSGRTGEMIGGDAAFWGKLFPGREIALSLEEEQPIIESPDSRITLAIPLTATDATPTGIVWDAVSEIGFVEMIA